MGRNTNAAEPAPNDSLSREVFTPLVLSMLSTTWRMFVPTLGLFFAGLWLDSLLGSKWLMIAGFVLGGAISVVLVWRQIRRSQG